MKFSKEITFPADPDTVREMLLDPVFRERVAEESGADTWQASVVEETDGVRARVETTQPADGLPSAAKKVLGGTFEIHQEEFWTSATEADLEVTIPGKPGHVRGTVTLSPGGDGTVQRLDADVTVRIPLVGGSIEKLIGSVLGRVLKIQRQVGTDWLAGA